MPQVGVWLECNGQSTSGYPALAAIVGSNVPDYRGMFLRGYGSQGGYSSGSVGALQGDAIRNITGVVSGIYQVAFNNFSGAFCDIGTRDSRIDKVPTNPTGYTDDIGFDASRVVPTANENRPVNKAVLYIIKAQ